MSLGLEIRLIAVLILILMSALFSSSEATFFTLLGRGGLAVFEKKSPHLWMRLKSLLEHPKHLIATLLIGNEIVNILISIFSASLLAMLFLDTKKISPFRLSLIATLISTGLILVFGEAIPKTLGVRFPYRLAPYLTPVIFWFRRIVFPVRYILNRLSEEILRLLGIRVDEEKKEGEQLLELVEMGGEEGILDETEYVLLKNIFEFGDLTVAEVMTPRQEIFSLPMNLEYSELKKRLLESGYSRVPVYKTQPEWIIGILTAKDLLRLEGASEKKSISEILHRPFCVPPTKKLNDLLRDFLSQNVHSALVVNEYGEIQGLVTLEDLLEEIFGESGETVEQPEILELGENRWEVLGRIRLREFNEKMGTELEASGIKTLAGYLLNEFGRVPAVGEELKRENFRFRVKEVKHRQIHKLEVEKIND